MQVRGRIAALLELGTGFNPEFTGRENIAINAAILGLSQREIAERLDDIIAFADIGTFIDQPVKPAPAACTSAWRFPSSSTSTRHPSSSTKPSPLATPLFRPNP